MRRIEAAVGDITRLGVDAIVNAANERMLGGGGVDGAIHRAAGPELLRACREFPEVRPGVRCPIGESRITPGFQLPARFVIHTVGPVWRGGRQGEAELLANCYRNSLMLAVDNELRTIAFPAISCGVYHYPIDAAATLAVRTISDFLASATQIDKVYLVAFDVEVRDALAAAIDRQQTSQSKAVPRTTERDMVKRVLILCTGNSCRSQMAESLWNDLGGGQWRVESAGSRPAGYVHPLAIEAMSEFGADLSTAESKHVDRFQGESIDLVVTVCDSAKEACPVFPGSETLHWPFPDPADAEGTDEQRLAVFREVRDEIQRKIESYLNDPSSD